MDLNQLHSFAFGDDVSSMKVKQIRLGMSLPILEPLAVDFLLILAMKKYTTAQRIIVPVYFSDLDDNLT